MKPVYTKEKLIIVFGQPNRLITCASNCRKVSSVNMVNTVFIEQDVSGPPDHDFKIDENPNVVDLSVPICDTATCSLQKRRRKHAVLMTALMSCIYVCPLLMEPCAACMEEEVCRLWAANWGNHLC